MIIENSERHTYLLNGRDEDGYFDEIGGFHSPPESWNPYGVWHGECAREICEDCPMIEDRGEN